MIRSWGARLTVIALAAAAGCLAVASPAQAWTLSPYAGSDGKLDIMPIGDSLTQGQGDPAWNGYRLDLRTRLSKVGQSPNMVGPWVDGTGDNDHAGTSGARIDQINIQIAQLMTVYKPDVAIVMAGTNDITQDYELGTAPDRLMTLVARLRAWRPATRVFVATLPRMTDPARTAKVLQYNTDITNAVVGLADPQVTVLPVGARAGEDPAKDLTADGVHLTPCGYARAAFIMWLHMGLSNLRPPADTWPGGYWPWGSDGVCA